MKKLLLRSFLETIHQHEGKDDIIYDLVKFLRDNLKIFSVAVRIKEDNDFPYYTSLGFSDNFIKAENFLCCADKNCKSNLECMCGAVINKLLTNEKDYDCYTDIGSFWTNSTKNLIETTNGDVGVKTRGTCVEYGYKSMALIPISYKGVNIGLIQLNDFEENKFDKEIIESLEGIGIMVGKIIGDLNIQSALKEEKVSLIKQNIRYIVKELMAMSEDILQNTKKI